MTPALAAPLFVLSITAMLAAADQFARRLDHLGLRFGFPEALLGLLTALAADAPEITSAIVALVDGEHGVAVGVVVGSNAFNIAAMVGLSAVLAPRIHARHESLVLEAFVGIWITLVACLLVAHALAAATALLLVAVVVVPYVTLLAIGPHRLRRLPLGAAAARFVHRSFGEGHRAARPRPRRGEALHLPLLLLGACLVIVATSILAVRSAVELADSMAIPHALVGVIVLAILTSLPNSATAVRFGMHGRGSALVSETLNSNSINLVVGIVIPAAITSLGTLTGLNVFDLVWLLLMTCAALALLGRRAGAGRGAGFFLFALYAVFVGVQVVAQT